MPWKQENEGSNPSTLTNLEIKMKKLITETPIYIYNTATDEIDSFTPSFEAKEWGTWSAIIKLTIDMNFDKLKKLYQFAKELN